MTSQSQEGENDDVMKHKCAGSVKMNWKCDWLKKQSWDQQQTFHYLFNLSTWSRFGRALVTCPAVRYPCCTTCARWRGNRQIEFACLLLPAQGTKEFLVGCLFYIRGSCFTGQTLSTSSRIFAASPFLWMQQNCINLLSARLLTPSCYDVDSHSCFVCPFLFRCALDCPLRFLPHPHSNAKRLPGRFNIDSIAYSWHVT